MASDMAMTEPLEDQEQNWILGHLHTFAFRVLEAAALDSRAQQGWQRVRWAENVVRDLAEGKISEKRIRSQAQAWVAMYPEDPPVPPSPGGEER
jgi:hypothetical protein